MKAETSGAVGCGGSWTDHAVPFLPEIRETKGTCAVPASARTHPSSVALESLSAAVQEIILSKAISASCKKPLSSNRDETGLSFNFIRK